MTVSSADRWSNGTVKIDRKAFPNGIAPLADYAHSKGLCLFCFDFDIEMKL